MDTARPVTTPDDDRPHAVSAPRAFDGERFIPGGAQVLVAGGRILAVTPPGSPLPEGCRVTRFPDCTLLPGLIDAHVHLCAGGERDALALDPSRSTAERETVVRRSLAQQLAAGVTGVRDLGDHAFTVADRNPRPDEPLVVAAGPPITSPGGHCAAMGGEASGDAELVSAVAQRAEHGAGVVKIVVSGGAMTAGSDLLTLQFQPRDVGLVAREAHRLGLPVTAHAHSVPAVRACLEAGVDGIEHCTCVTDHGIDTPPDLIEALATSGTAISPTLGRLPGSEPSPQAVEVMRRTGMSVEARFVQVGVLHRAGASLLAGSDAGIHPAKPHGVLPYSVIELAACGLSSGQALATATSATADALGWAGLTGRLRPGLRADLLLVDGDLRRSIGDLTEVRDVYLAGRAVSGRR